MGFSFGTRPYSTVSYNIRRDDVVAGPDTDITYNILGDGGLTEVYAGTGVKITNTLMVGIKGRYLFGSIEENLYADPTQDTIPANTSVSKLLIRNNFSDVTWSGSIALRQPVSDKRFINAAFTYDAASNVSSELFSIAGRAQSIGGPLISDTLFIAENEDRNFKLPSTYHFGLGYEYRNHFAIEANARLQNWKDFGSRVNNETGIYTSEGQQGYRFNFSGTWMPDYTSVKYYNRISYMAGLQLGREPFAVNGDQINEFGINFGAVLPVGLSTFPREVGSIKMLFTVGQRGTTENNLIQERFFRVGLGVNFNQRWFIKRKID
jgi:hypothetical protein